MKNWIKLQIIRFFYKDLSLERLSRPSSNALRKLHEVDSWRDLTLSPTYANYLDCVINYICPTCASDLTTVSFEDGIFFSHYKICNKCRFKWENL